MTEYRVSDGARVLTFDGTLLGASSSERDSSPRWTEINIYRTTAGRYVVTRTGLTKVMHVPSCPNANPSLKKFQDVHPGENPDDFHYDDCVPEVYDPGELLIEDTRRWTAVADTATAAIEHLYMERGGAKFLPWLASAAIEDAAMKDKAIADAYLIEERI